MWLPSSGGNGGMSGFLSGLWRYVRSSRQWVWCGSANDEYMLNTRLVTSSTTNPGARADACSVVDPETGIVYLYGGQNSNMRGEIFSLSPSLNWTWVAGDASDDQLPE